MAKMTKTARAARAQDLFAKKCQIESQTKSLYGELDEVEADLIGMIQASGVEGLPLGDGRTLVLNDNFLDRDGRPKNKAWKQTCISRFSVGIR